MKIAKAYVIYDNPYNPNRYDEQTKHTDGNGEAKFVGEGKMGASLGVSAEGYYGFGTYNSEDFRFPSGELEGGVEKRVALRSIIKPTALFGTFEGGGIIPEKGKWCSYDLEVADWVTPNGEGKTSDLLLRFSSEFVGFEKRFRQKSVEAERAFSKKAFAARSEEWTEEKFRHRAGDWDLCLEIAFPKPKEGMIRVVEAFNPHSVLRMPHQAPEISYEPTYRYEIKTYGESAWDSDNDIGFFLRTRVVLDEDGEIESANYAKIHEDFKVTVDGKVSFKYYFNPVANDRNLEFDSTRNLFPKGTPGTFNFVLP